MENPISESLLACLKERRRKLAVQDPDPVLLWSGSPSPRNFPHNLYPFRASSHFLYFAGMPLSNAVIRMADGQLQLFRDEASPSSALWHGESPLREMIAEWIGAEAHYSLAELPNWIGSAATIPHPQASTLAQQVDCLQRPLQLLDGSDLALAHAIIQLRLVHDQAALAEIRQAIAVTVEAHRAGLAATEAGILESRIRAAMEQVIISHDHQCAYNSIVTVQGEVLHNEVYLHRLQAGDLVLADVGSETPLGWASDVTRTWPVSGRFSSTQRAVYDVVLAAHDACIAKARPNVEYQDLHLLAASVIAEGLRDLGILRGSVAELVERDVHALFFPHGVGHLLGLDVHDMEDLGDLAGYATGRERSSRFGLGYLRLNRPLQAGMVVTIEPGFYQVPALLTDPDRRQAVQGYVDWQRLAEFADVRGIRIEDDVLITETGSEVLTSALPTRVDWIEQAVREGKS